MLNRDFTKTKKDYLNKNKAVLISLAVFLVIGLLVMAIFGFNTTPEFEGGHVVDIKIAEDISDKEFDKYEDKIKEVLNDNNLSCYSVQLKGEGDNSVLEVKYTGKLTDEKINKINAGFVKEIEIAINEFEHLEFSSSVSSTDYIYAVVAGLIILIIASVFVIFRHNIAYAMALMGASLFSVLSLLSLFSILRLTVSSHIFFVILLGMIYTIYESLILFEKMRDVASLKEDHYDKTKHIVMGMKNNVSRLQYTSLALFFTVFVFVVFGTSNSRPIALGLMFAIIVTLVSVALVIPFIYNLTIEKVTLKTRKVADKKVKEKSTKTEEAEKEEIKEETEKVEKTKEETEEVVEERYTEAPVEAEVVGTEADTTNLDE